jgi:hypothetical protein
LDTLLPTRKQVEELISNLKARTEYAEVQDIILHESEFDSELQYLTQRAERTIGGSSGELTERQKLVLLIEKTDVGALEPIEARAAGRRGGLHPRDHGRPATTSRPGLPRQRRQDV